MEKAERARASGSEDRCRWRKHSPYSSVGTTFLLHTSMKPSSPMLEEENFVVAGITESECAYCEQNKQRFSEKSLFVEDAIRIIPVECFKREPVAESKGRKSRQLDFTLVKHDCNPLFSFLLAMHKQCHFETLTGAGGHCSRTYRATSEIW